MTYAGSHDNLEGIAILGMAGHFPGANSVDDFWRNLRNGVEAISFFSDEELREAGVDPAQFEAPGYVRARAVLENVELFDARFFGYNPREAEILDPQQRLFLECAWEALEQAGYDPEAYPGKIGVFAGTSASSYLLHNLIGNREALALAGGYQVLISNDKDYLPTRVSYKLNLKGPSVNVQTSCSTSLVAVHLGCQSLLNYQSDIVLAGAVTVAVPQKTGYVYQESGIASPDGHCRPFDAAAQGTVGGSGIGIVVLKRLEDALADRDTIYAVIKGSAINNDGAEKVGYTAPSVHGQAEVIAEAQALAGFKPESISYVEAHGTATSIGDPIELKALTQVFRAQTQKKGFCAIGSVKSNIGHLDAAAGIAGLIKTVLALKNREIPPSLHFKEPNPQIDYDNIPFYVNTRLTQWEANGTARRAGVSSFGIGGTNAHLVLEEAPPVEESGTSPRPAQVLIWSAKTDAALEQATRNLADYLASHPDEKLADIAYTLSVGRRGFGHRRALVCRDREEAIHALKDDAKAETSDPCETKRSVAFMFAGQGTQYAGMGQELYQTEKVFRAAIDRCSELLQDSLGLDLRHLLFPSDERREEADRLLKQTQLTQPALFAFEYALAQQWAAWGVAPSAMIGHSIGEYVAACLAGVFTLEEALRIVATRGRLIQQLPGGAMLAVMMGEPQLLSLLEDHPQLSVAAVNAEGQCVVSGEPEGVEVVQAELLARGVIGKPLETSHAFHSAMMEPVLNEFRREVARLSLHTPRLPWVSNVTGTWITADEATDADYWVRHLRQPVRFGAGLGELLKDGQLALLEVGPGETLSKLARDRERSGGRKIVSSLSHRSQTHTQSQSDVALLKACGELWMAGVDINWNEFYAAEHRRRIPLPTYPFERQRYWVESRRGDATIAERQSPLDRQADVSDWFYIPTWKRSVPSQHLRQAKEEAGRDHWLVLTDGGEVGSLLIQRLVTENREVISVLPGGEREFARLEEGGYRIDARRREHYEKLLAELKAESKPLTKIVHLWSLTGDGRGRVETKGGTGSEAQWASFESLLALAQVFGDADGGDARPLEIVVVTGCAYDVTGRERIRPEMALIQGLCLVIGQEFGAVSCRVVDVEAAEVEGERQFVDQLASELDVETVEPIVAYRGGHRWLQDFEAMRLEAAGSSAESEHEAYLVTDIYDDAAYALAKQTARAKQGAGLYVLVRPETTQQGGAEEAGEGNNGIGATAMMGEAMVGDAQDANLLRERVQALRLLGAQVLVSSVDLHSKLQVREAVRQMRACWGNINGVIHAVRAPGEFSHRVIRDVAPQVGRELLEREVEGLLNLQESLDDETLDFGFLLSSSASVLGGQGRALDAAAGCFATSFAQSSSSRLRWTRVVWNAEQAVDEHGLTGANHAAGGRTESDFAEAGHRLMTAGRLQQVVVSPVALKALLRRASEMRLTPGGQQSEERGGLARHARSDAHGAYVAPRNEVEREVATIWENMLGIERVSVHDDFFNLGGHSLAGIQLIFTLRQKFEVEDLHLNSLFDNPTVAGLAESIERARRREILWPNIIVPMQSEGTRPPFFCVHPIGGDMFGLVDLARHMAPDHPFYGIQAEGLNDIAVSGDYKTLEELAAGYIEAIKCIASEGPYLLGGFSYGGIVSFEMGHQLKRRGEEVALLAMLDTPAPKTVAKVALLDDVTLLYTLARVRARQFGVELNLKLNEVRAVEPSEQLSFIGERLKAIGVAPADLNEIWLRNFIKGFRMRIDTTVNYVPQVYPGRITLFRASEKDSEIEVPLSQVLQEDYDDPHMGWDKVSGEPIDVQVVAGHHEMIVRGAYSSILAEKLKASIDKNLMRVGAM